jgi:8-amino-7-oxononanoate synthase
LYDTLLAHNTLAYILENTEQLKEEIQKRQQIVYEELQVKMDGLIAPVVIGDNKKVIEIKESLAELGFAVAGIRQPTVPRAIIRVIARVGEDEVRLRELCSIISDLK